MKTLLKYHTLLLMLIINLQHTHAQNYNWQK